ncbi:MAG: caspase family protein [Pseudomonadota bacterium]
MRIIALLALFVMITTAATASAADRVALVIGNSAYRNAAPLSNPRNDATDIADALRKLKFDVVQGIDLDRLGMENAIRSFTQKSRGAKVIVFFYAGHGLQVDNVNYLVPVDAKLDATTDLNFAAVSLDYVLRQMDAEQRINLIFLDACRDNPFVSGMDRKLATRSASVGAGLAQVKGSIDTMIAFATQPDNVALDGDGRNSPFTAALLKHIQTPGLEISSVLRRVRTDVVATTKEKQIPWDHSSLRTEVVLQPQPSKKTGNIAEIVAEEGLRATIPEAELISGECDRLAADPYSPNKPANVRGVHYKKVTKAAVQACAKAVVADQNNGRLHYQFGRALYYGAGDYAKARIVFKGAYDLGATEALTELGRMDFFGHGGPQSFANAMKTFEKAAKEGDASAIKNLGFMYQVGRGVKVDYARALKYYAMAPEHPVVMNNLGVLYAQGQGVPKDPVRAVRLFEQAMLGGDDSAPANLASQYELGEGVPKDLAKARILYEVGATYGDQIAQQALARLRNVR